MGHHGSTDPCPPQTAVPRTGGWGSLWVQTPGPPAWDAAHTFSGHQGGRLHGAGNLPEGQVASPTSPGDFLRDCTRASPSCCCAHRAAPHQWDCPRSLQPHGSTLDQFRKKPRLWVGRAGHPRGRAHSGQSGPQWTYGWTGNPGPGAWGRPLPPCRSLRVPRACVPQGMGAPPTTHGASGASVDWVVKWAWPRVSLSQGGSWGPRQRTPAWVS